GRLDSSALPVVPDSCEPDGEGESPVGGGRERWLAVTRDVVVAVFADGADVTAGAELAAGRTLCRGQGKITVWLAARVLRSRPECERVSAGVHRKRLWYLLPQPGREGLRRGERGCAGPSRRCVEAETCILPHQDRFAGRRNGDGVAVVRPA